MTTMPYYTIMGIIKADRHVIVGYVLLERGVVVVDALPFMNCTLSWMKWVRLSWEHMLGFTTTIVKLILTPALGTLIMYLLGRNQCGVLMVFSNFLLFPGKKANASPVIIGGGSTSVLWINSAQYSVFSIVVVFFMVLLFFYNILCLFSFIIIIILSYRQTMSRYLRENIFTTF